MARRRRVPKRSVGMITTKSPTALAGTPALSTSTLVQIRVDEDLKNEATSIFEQLGLDLPTAFRIFLKKSVEKRGIPFNMRVEKNFS